MLVCKLDCVQHDSAGYQQATHHLLPKQKMDSISVIACLTTAYNTIHFRSCISMGCIHWDCKPRLAQFHYGKTKYQNVHRNLSNHSCNINLLSGDMTVVGTFQKGLT